jgi:hypothetical protein
MATVIWLGLYLAMTIGGVVLFILELLYAGAPSFEYVVLTGATAVGGACLIWAECMR